MLLRKLFASLALGVAALGFAGTSLAQDSAASAPVAEASAAATPADATPAPAAEAAASDAAPAAAPVINKGDTAWMMVATLLVILMTVPGLALFYGGLVRSKNMLSVLMQVCLLYTSPSPRDCS